MDKWLDHKDDEALKKKAEAETVRIIALTQELKQAKARLLLAKDLTEIESIEFEIKAIKKELRDEGIRSNSGFFNLN